MATRTFCDRCDREGRIAQTQAMSAADSMSFPPIPPVDLCQRCWRQLHDWLTEREAKLVKATA